MAAKTAFRARAEIFRGQALDERRNVTAFDRLLVNSYFSRESALRAYGYGVDPAVCELGVDLATFTPGASERQRTVLVVGSMSRPKEPLLAVETVAASGQDPPTLRWVGPAPDVTLLEAVQAAAIEHRVSLVHVGVVPDEELVREYRTAGVVLVPSRLEPFGYTPIEAGACAAAVVARREGGLRETVVDGVNGLLGTGAAALGEACARVLDEPGLAASLGQGGVRMVGQRFSLQAASRRLERVLDAVIAEARVVGSPAWQRVGRSDVQTL